MTAELKPKHEAVLLKAAAVIRARGYEGDARLAHSVHGVIASLRQPLKPRATPPSPNTAREVYELPPLPNPHKHGDIPKPWAHYTADQMREYGEAHARAALASRSAVEVGDQDRLVTLLIGIDRQGHVHSDLQTHDNSYAEVAKGLTAIRAEIDRVFAEQKNCPHFPASAAEAKTKIVRTPLAAKPVASEAQVMQEQHKSAGGAGDAGAVREADVATAHEKFEAAMLSYGHAVAKVNGEGYIGATLHRWQGWCAAFAAAPTVPRKAE